MKRLFILGAAAVAALVPISVAPAHAEGVSVIVEGCSVQVASGASGIAVLDAAVAGDCLTIDSYSTVTYPNYGAFVDCINEVCGEALLAPPAYPLYAGTGWLFYINGFSSFSGVDSYSAANGDVLLFTYEGYAFPAT